MVDAEIEEDCFMEKQGVGSKILDDYNKHQLSLGVFAKRMEDLLGSHLLEHKAIIHSISYRVKESESLETKLIKKNNKYSELSEITDIIGFRIITYYEDAVDLVASSIRKIFLVDEVNTIDKREAIDPDRFGYLSLHYIVSLNEERCNLPEYHVFDNFKFEIQIRSILQHTWAEIEHDLGYKSKMDIPRNIQRDFSRLAGLLELADKEFMSIRDKTEQYKQAAKTEVESQSPNLLIDTISMRAYMRGNENLKKLDSLIAQSCKLKLLENSFSIGVAKYLKWLGFKTIKEVDEAIVQNHDLCIILALSLLKDTGHHSIDTGVGLFYLCYAKLVKERDTGLIVKYLIENSIGGKYDKDRDTFANDLISIYTEYELKNDK